MNAQRYPSDLTDDQFTAIEPLLPNRGGEGKVGRPPRYTNRQLLNGIFYALRTGCAWRYLPHDLPHWTSVYACWKRWSIDGTMDRIHDALRRLSYQTHAREDAGGRKGRGASSSVGSGGETPLAGMKGGRTSKGREGRAASQSAAASSGEEDGENRNPVSPRQKGTSPKKSASSSSSNDSETGQRGTARAPEAE